MVKRSDNLAEHCQKTHNDAFLALKPNERPKTPEYSNWKEYAEEYPSTEPVKNLFNETWWRADGGYQPDD